MDFFEHLRVIDFCTFLDFPTTCTVRNRPRVKIFEDGRVSLYGELRKRAAEQQRDYCARISPDGRCIALYPERTPNIHFHADGACGTKGCCSYYETEKYSCLPSMKWNGMSLRMPGSAAAAICRSLMLLRSGKA